MPYTRAQLLAAVKTDHPELSHIDDNKLFAAIAVDHPELAKGISELQAVQPRDDRSAGQVAFDQAGNVVKGAAGMVTGLPGMAAEGAGVAKSALSGNVIDTLKRIRGIGTSMAEGMAAPVTPILQTATSEMGLTPPATRQEWEQGAQAAGANAMSLALPEAAGAVGRAATPEALMTLANKARTIRAANPSTLSTLAKADITRPASLVQQSIAAAKSGGAAIAAPVLEQAAKLRAGAPEPTPFTMPEVIEKPMQTGPIEAPGLRAALGPSPNVPEFEMQPPASPVTPIEAPGLQEALGPSQNVPQLEMRPPIGPPQPIEAPGLQETLGPSPNVPQLEMRPPAGPSQPIEAPGLQEALGATTQGELRPFEIHLAQQGIAPASITQKLSTIRNIPDLLKEVPELRGTPPGNMFDAKLMNGFKRAEHNLSAVEESVPRETQVPIGDAVKQLSNLEQELALSGQNKSMSAVSKIREKLSEFPNTIPWEQFRDMKRAFFKEVSPSSDPARRAYRVLMDTSDKISPALTDANRSYYIVRTALENAKLDRFTGTRIRNVGKPTKPAMYNEPGKAQFRTPL